MKNILNFQKFNEAASYENLSYLINEYVDMIGDEEKIKINSSVYLFKSPFGSYRFVKYVDGVIVSAIQIMKREDTEPKTANVYTLPLYRRKGYALELYKTAEKFFGTFIEGSEVNI